ncbi:2-oxoglutarate dehydrogenase E1 component [Brackiella oedipodis]|uniref:2-oxoglutarate dehydrogenase E1 component n=1 Tax=Brackiella oedipodis TaxID=124225 RepID=UPI00048A58B4|nr:2-oxoglutarate dehydrogenase E1 component [Brackiella oedipodis]
MTSLQDKISNSYLSGGNATYIEELYDEYLTDPENVSPEWQEYFDKLQHLPATDGNVSTRDYRHTSIVRSFAERAKHPQSAQAQSQSLEIAQKQLKVQLLVYSFRTLGVRHARLDPLKRAHRFMLPQLDPATYGFTDSDLDTEFFASNTYFTDSNTMKLRDLVDALRSTYCGSVGAEFQHVSDPHEREWIEQRLESSRSSMQISTEGKKRILQQLTEAEGLERYLHTRYVGQKRFSLEGGESFIVAMDELVNHGSQTKVNEFVVGMAHRGRLNMLINIMGKMPGDLFAEFEGKQAGELTSGDVKYHNGFSSDLSAAGGPVHLSLAFNPSHLEIVNPVVEGSARARQERHGNTDEVLPVLVHGDAAFAGQGIVMETLNLAMTRGYGTGGTVHFVINNQIGFTTSDPRDARSTLYCTDVVKMIEAPVFHVNADDPEAVAFVTRLALDYRMKFKKDVVVDIICYRKLGHNEQDTPALTQPLMYKTIGAHPGTRQLYADKLVSTKVLGEDEPEAMVKAYRDLLDKRQESVEPVLTDYKNKYAIDWKPFLGAKWSDQAETALPEAELKRLGERITTIPEGFSAHKLVQRLLNDRRKMAEGEMNLDWGMGEHLAFASLVATGYPVRISGQDSGRGTFTHRHAVLHDQNRERWDGGIYIPLQNVSDKQAHFTVIDSVLSENAVLGFEYGYACAEPNTLTIWEAQFGDFANGAQVVIDQFITSGEAKWGRQCGLTLMLPHGYEGQGPEHSSARIERFLQLCADTNIQCVQPTTASQIFHLLRRQMIRQFRKPLVIFTPKSLLRNKNAASPMSEFTEGGFKTIIPEVDSNINKDKVKRILVCSGRVYYDLVTYRQEHELNDVAILRIEQLYPFAHDELDKLFAQYPNAEEIVWTQDEPRNQGPWFYIQAPLYNHMKVGQKLMYAGRPSSSSPAVGYMAKHGEQLKNLIEQAFGSETEVLIVKN